MADYEAFLVEYFQKIEAGLPVDPREIVQANPEYADRLQRFFRNAHQFEHLIDQLRNETPDSEPRTCDKLLSSGPQLGSLTHANPEEYHLTSISPFLGKTYGDYRIIRGIACGGMGVVYEAEQLSLGRRVALKILAPGVATDPLRLARFKTEAQAAARLNHEHIVPVYSVGEVDGAHYFAMKLIEGTTLSKLLKNNNGRFSHANLGASIEGNPPSAAHSGFAWSTLGSRSSVEQQNFQAAAHVTLTIACALEHAHQKGIIHRDIKPSNILIDESGKIWLADFGLAHLEQDEPLTTTGDVLGTVQYMSPEQATGSREIDSRTDIYSLGVILYQMLTGELPFRGNQRMFLHQVMNTEPVAPRTLDIAIPKDLETICLRCLEKLPERRFSSARELADELHRYLRQEPIHSRPVSAVGRTIRWVYRHPQTSAAIAAIGLLIICLGVGIPVTAWQLDKLKQAELVAQKQRELVHANASRAATQEYYATLSRLRELRAVREPGWTWKTIAGVKSAASLPADGRDPAALRSLVANALTSTDIRLAQKFASGITPGATALSPDGRYLAIGEIRATAENSAAKIFIFEIKPDSGQFKARPYRESRIDVAGSVDEIEGIRSLCFSPNNQLLAIGTRFGSLLEWNFHHQALPRIIRPADSDESQQITQLLYAPTGRQLIAVQPKLSKGFLCDTADGRQLIDFDTPFACVCLPENRKLLIPQIGDRCGEITNFEEPQINWLTPGIGTSLARGTRLGETLISSSASHPVVQDSTFGVRTLSLPMNGDDTLGRHRQFFVDKATSTLLAVSNRRHMYCWDALSGNMNFVLRTDESEPPLLHFCPEKQLLSISMDDQSALFDVRQPTIYPSQESLAEQIATQDLNHSNIIRTFAPGPWIMDDFCLSHDRTKLAIRERISIQPHSLRIRKFELGQLVESGRWLLHNTAATTATGLRSIGNGMEFSIDNSVIVASDEVGFQMTCDETGFGIPAGLVRPLATAEPQRIDDETIEYTWPENWDQENSDPYFRAGLMFRCDSGRINNTSSLVTSIAFGDQQAYTNNWFLQSFADVVEEGWTFLLLETIPSAEGPVKITVQATAEDWQRLEIGNAMLMSVRGKGQPFYTVGPMAIQGDGSLLSLDSGDRIAKWNGSTSNSPDFQWSDEWNPFNSFRDVAAADTSAIIGMRWGQVYHLSSENEITQLDNGPRGIDVAPVRNEIVSVAIDREGKLGFAGNRGGEVAMFDLTRKDDAFRFKLDAHKRSITDIAACSKGRLLVTASENSDLKFWSCRPDSAEFLFQLEQLVNPVQKMYFSADASQLFLLCRNERGLRVLDLHNLQSVFKSLSIHW
ncbi:MAG: WD40 repeat domain-containing serine/threonine protein kinase [bacterium]|nr:WD40 repeat domain-containing serine/threonine protein kinase [bacterium]